MDPMTQKQQFLRQLTEYLVKNQTGKSISLQMGHATAQEWAAMRGSTPIQGYPSIEEAEQILGEWLGITPYREAP